MATVITATEARMVVTAADMAAIGEGTAVIGVATATDHTIPQAHTVAATQRAATATVHLLLLHPRLSLHQQRHRPRQVHQPPVRITRPSTPNTTVPPPPVLLVLILMPHMVAMLRTS
jgi:hypothetical protein